MAYLNWQEWHERCLLARCSAETQQALRDFVSQRYRRAARRCAPYAGVGSAMARQESENAWHQFESFLCLRETRLGKPYKHWIFDRVAHSDDPPLAVVQGGAALLVRWVVRTQLRNEYSPPRLESLNAPLPRADGMTLQELIPAATSPVDPVEEDELQLLAEKDAEMFFAELEARERLVLWAKQARVSLASPRLEQLTGVKSSRLNQVYHQTLRKLAEWSRSRHPLEDDSTCMQLAIRAAAALKKHVFSWAAVENVSARGFPSQRPMILEDQSA